MSGKIPSRNTWGSGGGGGGGSSDCPFDGIFNPPANGTHVTGTTCGDFKNLFFSSSPPSISIAATPAFGLREFGNDVVNPDIRGRGALGSNPSGSLTLLELFRGTTGGTNLAPNEVNPTPGTWYARTDTFTVSSNQTYTARISDDQGRNGTASGNYRFTYPFYWGVVDEQADIFDNITRAQILALAGMGVHVETVGTKAVTTSPTNERYCFMYPASYGALSSVIDNNGFETLPAYDTFTYNVIGLDGTSQSYRVYILNADTTAVGFTNTYHF